MTLNDSNLFKSTWHIPPSWIMSLHHVRCQKSVCFLWIAIKRNTTVSKRQRLLEVLDGQCRHLWNPLVVYLWIRGLNSPLKVPNYKCIFYSTFRPKSCLLSEAHTMIDVLLSTDSKSVKDKLVPKVVVLFLTEFKRSYDYSIRRKSVLFVGGNTWCSLVAPPVGIT